VPSLKGDDWLGNGMVVEEKYQYPFDTYKRVYVLQLQKIENSFLKITRKKKPCSQDSIFKIFFNN